MQGQDVGAPPFTLRAGNKSSNRLTKRRRWKWGGAPNLMEYSYPHHFVMITDETPWQGEDVRR